MTDEQEPKTRFIERVAERTRTLIREGAEAVRASREGGTGLIERTKQLVGRAADGTRSFTRGGAGAGASALIERARRGVAARGAAFWGRLATVVTCAWLLADVGSALVDRYLPDAPPARPTAVGGFSEGPRARALDDYAAIWNRNLFNSEGKLPGEETATGGDPGGMPVRTSLPFNLVGVVVLRDELRSIATIEDKSASQVYPVRAQDEIPQKARILQVLPDRVVFVNLQNNRREFVDLPEENVANPRVNVGRPKAATGGGIERVAPNQFNVSRTEVDKALQNLNQVLTQARAVPNFENGVPAGYKLFQIVPGSIYDKLGLQNGDVLCGLNGAAINDPGKAFEMLTELKTASALELCVKRDGRTMNNNYEIR